MYISEDIVEEVRSRNDIVDVISSYVKLQKKGGSYFGLCPFHNEKSPSFSVSGNKQMFYCFGCGEGGNVFSFLMKYDSLTFTEALKTLAQRAGIDLPEIEVSAEEKKKESLKASIFEVNKEAARYFHYLLNTEAGTNGKRYLEKRELKPETITAFGLGASGMRSDELYRYMKNKGFTDEVLKQTGLFVYDEHGAHDMFRNRVMYPILNVNNKVIGFGGRVMGDAKPKYLNTPETPVFDKGRNLFGLNIAKNAKTNNMIICEGYMDVISMHQAGFTQAVAALGVGMTDVQASMLKRYTKEILICYDSDAPGTKASLRAIGILKNAGLRTRVINLEPHKDADEFIKSEGLEAFEQRIENAENSFLFEIRILQREFDLQDPAAKTAFYNEVAKKLAGFEEELERNNYIDAVAEKYFISANSLKQLVAKYAATVSNITVNKRDTTVKDKDNAINKSQRMLLTFIADDIGIYKKISPYITALDFTEGVYRRVADLMFSNIEEGKFNPATILNNFSEDEDHNEVAKILNTNILDEAADKNDREKAVNDAVLIIKRNSLEQRSSTTSDIAELQQIIQEQQALRTLHISLN